MRFISARTFVCISLSASFAFAVPFEGHQVLMSGPSPLAIEAGKKVAQAGGNAVDVAVAMGLVLSVTSPYYATLGGGGFALVKMGTDEPQALDFRETAPAQSKSDMYAALPAESSQNGGLAVGIPGFPAGLEALHKKYGKLPWGKLFDDAIRLAENGFPVSGEWTKITRGEKSRFNGAALRYLFKGDAGAYVPGEILRQPQMARALRKLKGQGADGFYSGSVAKDIAASVQKAGGIMTVEDLRNYKVRWLKPLTTEFQGYKLHLMPPPSSGGLVIASALKLVERLKPEQYKPFSADELHTLAEILKRSFRGRSLLGDPDFHKNPLNELLSKKYLNEAAAGFSLKKAGDLKPVEAGQMANYKESSETTHFSVLDKDGNAVALTVTANGNYGSAVLTDDFGITLNNEMDDFTTKPGEPNQFGLIQGEGNNVQPGKRPLSSMSPSLVEKNGKIVLTAGAPGGPRIISAVFQTIYRILVTKMDADSAVQAPRVHHQFLPNTLYLDTMRLPPESVQALESRGHKIDFGKLAKAYVVRMNESGWLEAAFDSRGEGAAGGY